MSKKYDDELIEKARSMREAGESYGSISKATGIPKSSLVDHIRDIPGPAPEARRGDGLPASMGPAQKVELSRENIDAANQLRALQLQNEKLKQELESRTLRRRLDVMDREDSIEFTERMIAAGKREAALLAAQTQSSQDGGGQGDAAQEKLEAVMKRNSELEIQLAAEKAAVVEERRRAEIDGLKDQIAALAAAKQVGATQWDIIGQAINAGFRELGGLRADIVAVAMAPGIRVRFAPGRHPLELRTQQGETLVAALEGAPLRRLRCPHCGAAAPISESLLQSNDSFMCTICQRVFPNPIKQSQKPEGESS